jgi:hypothetical protein
VRYLAWLVPALLIVAACSTTTNEGPFKITCDMKQGTYKVTVSFLNTAHHTHYLGSYRVTFYSDQALLHEVGQIRKDFPANTVRVKGDHEHTWHTHVSPSAVDKKPQRCQVTGISS